MIEASLFVLDTPRCKCVSRREVAKRSAANWRHGISTPTDGLPEPPSLPATVLSRSTLGLNGSIIIASACHGLRCGLRRTVRVSTTADNTFSFIIVVCVCVFALVACRVIGSRGNVKNALYCSIFKEQWRDKKAPHFPCRKMRGLHTLNF